MTSAFVLAASLIFQGQSAPPPASQAKPPVTQAQADEAKHQSDLKADSEYGKKMSVDAEKQFKTSENKEYQSRVQRIGNEIAAIARVTPVEVTWGDKRLNPFDYKFKVLQGKDVNAFSLPGGYIYVFEGLMKYVETDDELAGILGHEISHAAFRHIHYLQHEQGKIDTLTIPLILAAILKGGANAGNGVVFGQLLNVALGSGWSLKAEQAADYGGFQYLIKSKYNPTAMLTVMERLARDERNSPRIDYGIFRDHPPSRERANAIVYQLNVRHIPIRRSAVTTSLRATAKKTDKGAFDIFFGPSKLTTIAGKDAEARAQTAVTKLNEMYDSTPELYEVRLDGSDIQFKNRTVLSLNGDDATAVGKPLNDVSEQTYRAVRGALFSLTFSVWDERGLTTN